MPNYATHCQFEAALNDTLRDRLVVGLRQESIQKRLLSETDLNLEKAINLAVAMETAARDAAEVQGVKPETVHKINTQPKPRQPQLFSKKPTVRNTYLLHVQQPRETHATAVMVNTQPPSVDILIPSVLTVRRMDTLSEHARSATETRDVTLPYSTMKRRNLILRKNTTRRVKENHFYTLLVPSI